MTKNRLIELKRTQTLFVLFISGFCSITLGSPDFHLITQSKTYAEAKTYCREMHTDLATVQDNTEMSHLVTLVSNDSPRAWIGLESGDEWMWHWSLPDQELDFFNWGAGEPQNTSQDVCAAMDQNGTWFESQCGTKRSFVCHSSSETSGHIFVAETKSWRDAQNHCRGLSSELISIQSAEENEAIRNISESENVWIGLFKDPWKWSDGSNSSFRYWKPSQPNYLEDQDCTVAVFRDDGKWNDLKCTSKRDFVCRGAVKSTTTTQSSTNPTTNTSPLTTSATTTSTPFITTDATTNTATTTSELTTLNTTNLVSSSSGNELNNATPEMSTVTTTELPPTTTVQVTTYGISTSTTLNSTRSTTLQTTENTPSLAPDNLVLIQKNMTWIEAMSYCREHHIDLIQITTHDIQEKVAEKAKSATSAHVWLGLRYTCDFGFWFWTSSADGCYLNWAPGQGPEGIYDCGVTGAIEATGGQQWVGLPETEKLNFICYACAG